MVLIHYTAMESAEAALARLCDPQTEVSAHYLIGRDGKLWHMVAEDQRAWHAGAGCWGDVTDINSHAIGIELDNLAIEPFSEPLMTTLEALLGEVTTRHSIPPERVLGHSDTAPGRKSDPGPRFDWVRLARLGLACWPSASAGDEGASAPEETAPTETEFLDALKTIGYGDAPPDTLLSAFRLRFRPQAKGPLAAADLATARDLARRFPVRPG